MLGAPVQSTQTLTGVRATRSPRTRQAVAAWLQVGRRFGNVLSDTALVWMAFWVAYLLRYELELGGPIRRGDWQPFTTFQGRAALFVALTVAVFLIRGVYRLPRWTGFLDEALMVTGGLTTAMAGVILPAYFLRFSPSRLVFLYAWLCAIAFLLGKRVLVRRARHWFWKRGIAVDRVLVVGAGPTGRRVMRAMLGQPALGCRLVGFVDDHPGADLALATEHRVSSAEYLGSPDALGDIVTNRRIDEVIVALPAEAQDRVLVVVDRCRACGVPFKVVPDLFQLALDRVDIGEVAGVPLIGFRDASISGGNYVVKRTIDIVVATIALLVAALPMAAIAMLIRRGSPGPVLIRQSRVGRGGVPFSLLKFRTMIQNADEQRALLIADADGDPRLFKLRDDPRLTRVGRVLRRWSLDELPQLVHVLRGEMSVVGPRPPLPEEVARYQDWHRQRLQVTPGLTGLWQVNGRSTLAFDDMVRLDLYYAEHWSPWLDVKVVLRTIPAVLTGRGAW